ncbi:MAG: hypothetical protein KIT74_09515 [Fimbriimonadales bacterium]|nr:hypothetical protein [Fimbriimonadales bacterium]
MEYTNPIGLSLNVPLQLQGTETTASLAIQDPSNENDVCFLSYLYGPGVDLKSGEVIEAYEQWLREGLGSVGFDGERHILPDGIALFYAGSTDGSGSVVAWSLRSIGDLAAGLVGISSRQDFDRSRFLELSAALRESPRQNPELLSRDWKWSDSRSDPLVGFSMAVERTYRLTSDGSFQSWSRAIGGTAAYGVDSGTEVDTVGVWGADDRRLILLTNSSITAWTYYLEGNAILLTSDDGDKTLWQS